MSRICLHRGRTSIWLHSSALIMAGYMAITGYADLLLVAYTSIILHEAAHAVAASCLGWQPDDIELTPMGAMMYLHEQARIPPLKRAVILSAGPIMTLVLCWISILLTKHGLLPPGTGRLLFMCNAGILLVNALPCLPLDGGNLLSLLLARFLPFQSYSRILRIIGSICGISFILLSFTSAWYGWGLNLSLIISGCFLRYAAHKSTATAALNVLRELMDRKVRFERQGIVWTAAITAFADMPVMRLISMLPRNRYAVFNLLERGTLRCIGSVGEAQVIKSAFDHPTETAGELVEKDDTSMTEIRLSKRRKT